MQNVHPVFGKLLAHIAPPPTDAEIQLRAAIDPESSLYLWLTDADAPEIRMGSPDALGRD